MLRSCSILIAFGLCAPVLACGGGSTPPPQTEESVKGDPAPKKPAGTGGAQVSQELGSIDQRAVEQTFDKLQTKLEACHKQARDRLEFMAGDMKVFLRIGQDGRVKYGHFEESTIGDRATEKCILDLFGQTDWPKPQGGEAEVRNGFGWSPGGERPPAAWGSEKVTTALEADKETKKAITTCKAGVTGDFRVTAYVEPHDAEPAAAPAPTPGPGKGGGKGGGKGAGKNSGTQKTATAAPEASGRFKALGASPPGKEAADKVDCVLDAIKGLSLPSPGSYVAKVTFTL